jgi:hypothetical protein
MPRKPSKPSLRTGFPTSMTLTHEAHKALKEMLPGPGKMGEMMSQLIMMEVARREERQRLAAERESADVAD